MLFRSKPLVIRVWVPLPLYQILLALLPSESSGVQNGLDFIFLFPINQIRGGAQVVTSMERCLMIGGEKISVKHWMDAPLRWQLQSISDWGHHLVDGEWAMPPGRKLGSRLFHLYVAPFQPHLVPYFVLGRCLVLYSEGLRPGHEFLGLPSCLFELF